MTQNQQPPARAHATRRPNLPQANHPFVSKPISPFVPDAQLAPPRSSGRLVPREALLAQLQAARRHRCVVVQGPAGCGKTTVMAAWRQAVLALGFDVAWLMVAADDDEPTRFLDGLLASLAQVSPALTREAAEFAGHGVDREAIERITCATSACTTPCSGCSTTRRPTCT